MTMMRPKVTIIGGGNVGMRYAYALMIKGLARQIVFIDPDRKKLEGEVMDLSHGAPYLSPVDVLAGEYPDIRDSDLVVFTAGKRQKPGQSRIDLVRDNVDLFRSIIPEVMKHAPSAIFLVVSNPVDILAYAAYKISGKPVKEVIGSGTVLDSARFRYLLARKCFVDPRNIHAYILGEHGDTEFAAWSRATIGGILFKEYCPVCRKRDRCEHGTVMQDIFAEVRDSAYKIIEKKGETSYAIGLAAVRITQAILDDENAILPVSSLVQGYLGIQDVYLSLPAVLNRSGIREIFPIMLSREEEEAMRRSAEALKQTIQQVGI
jgi:L-lactate dehydrogenase